METGVELQGKPANSAEQMRNAVLASFRSKIRSGAVHTRSDDDRQQCEASGDGVRGVQARTLPPHNGYGSPEDSAENCKGLQPRPPRKDFHRLMQMHRIVLRYSCRFFPDASHHLSPADK